MVFGTVRKDKSSASVQTGSVRGVHPCKDRQFHSVDTYNAKLTNRTTSARAIDIDGFDDFSEEKLFVVLPRFFIERIMLRGRRLGRA